MKIEIKIDGSCTESEVIIKTDSVGQANDIVKLLSAEAMQMITGIRNNEIELLSYDDLIRIFAENGRVIAVTPSGEYFVRMRLYELEEQLSAHRFVRISNSEIINLKKVSSFDLSITGTICVKLLNSDITYVSRRYVPKIKKILGI